MSNITGVWGTVIKYALIVLVVLAILGSAAYFGDQYGSNKVEVACQAASLKAANQAAADKAALQKQIDDRQLKINELSGKLQTALGKVTVVKQVVHDTVIKEVQSAPVYQSCLLPPSGPILLNKNAQQYNELIGGSP